MHTVIILIGLSLVFALTANPVQADVHPEVQKALDWQLQSHECGKRPTLRTANNTTNQAEETVTSDIDHYTRKRHERKLKRWDKCYKAYRNELMDDFAWLKDSAKYGMTQAQAETVMGHLKTIQDTLMAET